MGSLKFANKKPIRMRQFFSHVRYEHKYAKQSVKGTKKQHAKKLHITNVQRRDAVQK